MDKEIKNIESTIKKIVSESMNAPSGDNCQPWYFNVSEETLFIYKKDEGNNNYLDFKSRGTLLAHGALIENISIVAKHYGYIIETNLFPEKDKKDLVVEIRFLKNNILNKEEEDLFEVLPKRTTNRKEYFKKNILQKDKNQILNNIDQNNIVVDFIENEVDKNKVFTSTTQMERIALQNKFLHKLFFESIVWSKKEEAQRKQGLYLKTMELPPPVVVFFKLLKFWPVAKFLSKIGFSKKVAENNASSYQSSCPIIFSIKNTDPVSYIELGRVVERVWLRATKLDIAVQPLAGVLYVYQRLHEDGNKDAVLSKEEAHIIEDSYQNIKKFISSSDATVSMILRVGYSKKPSARSSKKEPEFL
ncbi:MAG: hypothetical protein QG674_405 [Patescibacteria group bacterium]|nr:hypothetical protein [Patescibacteria group bacterium]